MKPTSIPRLVWSCCVKTSLAAAVAVCLTPAGQAQTDNFDNGSDAAWQKSTTATYPANFTFVPDMFGGKAYRLQALNPTDSATAGAQNTARAVAVLTDTNYTTFYVSADLVAWNTNNTYDATNDSVIGIIARASNVTTPDQLTGIIFATHYTQYGDATGGTRGTAQIYGVISGGGFLIPAAQGNFTINPGHRYRMVFAGTNNTWQGSWYDLEDLTHPLLTLTCDDTYAPGYFPTSGYSGLFTLGYRGSGANVNDTSADATFDNFVASTYPPTSVALPATPFGMVGAPQVINRTPASYANFYNPAGGISFTATTLTTTNAIVTSAIRLVLNGVDVTSSLAITGPTPSTNANVTFSGLSPNCLYKAQVELLDSYGRHTTNAWTFDTFSDSYLASASAKNIECEEYDFNGGQYYNSPTVSGYTTNGAEVNVGFPNTYAGTSGVNANPSVGNPPPFDFFDWDTSSHNLERDFRTSDAVGTQNGALNYQAAYQGAAPYIYYNDNGRQKYLTAQPDGSLIECGVERTEGQEWLNYTRSFSGSSFYNVYLRHACGLTQPVSLDQIGVGPTTNNLGTFNCVNAFALASFCYQPLLDNSGKLATVNLTGVNTLRLTMAAPHVNGVKAGLWLNYLAFVPAVPQIYSSATPNGTYSPEVNALVDTTNKRLTVPQTGGARFYRIGWNSQVRVTDIALSGSNIVLSYQ
jgi:hypothetical protein